MFLLQDGQEAQQNKRGGRKVSQQVMQHRITHKQEKKRMHHRQAQTGEKMNASSTHNRPAVTSHNEWDHQSRMSRGNENALYIEYVFVCVRVCFKHASHADT